MPIWISWVCRAARHHECDGTYYDGRAQQKGKCLCICHAMDIRDDGSCPGCGGNGHTGHATACPTIERKP